MSSRVFRVRLSFDATDKGRTNRLMMDIELAFHKAGDKWRCEVNDTPLGLINTHGSRTDSELQELSKPFVWDYLERQLPSLTIGARSRRLDVIN